MVPEASKTLPVCLFLFNFNVILQCTPASSKWSLPFDHLNWKLIACVECMHPVEDQCQETFPARLKDSWNNHIIPDSMCLIPGSHLAISLISNNLVVAIRHNKFIKSNTACYMFQLSLTISGIKVHNLKPQCMHSAVQRFPD